MTAERIKHCQKRKTAMLDARQPYESDFAEVADFVDPYAGRHLRDRGQSTRKLPSRRKILSNEAGLACRTMDAGFMGGHTSKARPWFRLSITNKRLADNEEVKVWLDDATQVVRDILAGSNLYTALPKLYHSRHLFGFGAILIEQDDESVVRFYNRSVGTYAFTVDYRGRCSAFWYCYKRKACDLVKKYGESALPKQVVEKAKTTPDEEYTVESVIEENPDYKKNSRVELQRKYRQTYWIEGGGMTHLLDETGYDRMPVLTPRWLVDGNDVYGTSPALEALADVKQLQHQTGEGLLLTDLLSRPPMGLPESMRGKAASLNPGSRTYVTADQQQSKAEPLYVPLPQAKNEIRLDIAECKEAIRAAFYADLFRMLDFLDDRQRTAYEISERKEEKVAMLGPSMEVLSDELLDPLVEYVFYEAMDTGRIPLAPQALRDTTLTIEYTSMLAQAQRAVGIGTVERVLGTISALQAMKPQDPSVSDKLNMDATIELVHDMAGAPARMLNTDEDVDAMREGRAQQQNMQQMAALAPAMKQATGAMRDMADTVPQEGSALESMAGA